MAYAWFRYDTASKVLPRSNYVSPGCWPDVPETQRPFLPSHLVRLALCAFTFLVSLFFISLAASLCVDPGMNGAQLTVAIVIAFPSALALIASIGLPISWYRTHRLLMTADQ